MPATMHYEKTLNQTRSEGHIPLSQYISDVLITYFENMGDQIPENLYALVMTEMEQPLLEAVMRYTRNNQSKPSIFRNQ